MVQQQMAMSERRHRDELDRARQERKEENRWSFVKEIGPAILGFGGSILSAMGNNGLGSFLEGIAGEAAQAQQAAAGMGGFDPTGGAAPGGFSPGPGGPGPGPGGFSPGPSPSPSGAPAGFSPSPAGFGPAPGGGVPPGFQATPSAPPSPPPAPPSAANFDHLTPLQKAHRFGELFSGAAWETLRAGMVPEQIQALEQLITNQEPENVRPLMQLFTQALKAHLPGDEALSSVLTREQVQSALYQLTVKLKIEKKVIKEIFTRLMLKQGKQPKFFFYPIINTTSLSMMPFPSPILNGLRMERAFSFCFLKTDL